MEYARAKSGYSQPELEKLLGIGRGYYRHLKRMGVGMLAATLLAFCHATHADVAFIVYGEGALADGNSPPAVQLNADSIGGRIREFRVARGLSQKEFARKIGYEKASGNILEWEKNRHSPRLESLLRIAEAFGIGVESFFPIS